MTRKRIIFILLFLNVIGQTFGQDTITYKQANSCNFINNYTLIRKDNSDNFGIFKQYGATDDLQHWFGSGTFTETRRKIILTYDTVNHHNHIETVSSTDHRDTLCIKWFDWTGIKREWFSIRYTDTTLNKSIFQANWETGIVKIPRSELKDKRLSLYVLSRPNKLFDFEISDEVEEVRIIANLWTSMHITGVSKKKLIKKKNGFKTVGMFTNGKRTFFVKQQ